MKLTEIESTQLNNIIFENRKAVDLLNGMAELLDAFQNYDPDKISSDDRLIFGQQIATDAAPLMTMLTIAKESIDYGTDTLDKLASAAKDGEQ